MTTSFTEIEIGPTGGVFPAGPLQSAAATADGVSVTFAGGTVVLPGDWLRDNCPCDRCRIRQTDERRWQPWSDTAAARADRVDVSDGSLAVQWSSGHESTYSPATWASIARAGRRGVYTARLWQKGYAIERFDHDETIADTVTQRRMFEAFRRDGAVVVTGSPTVPGTVIEYLRAIRLTLRDSSLGLIFDVKLDPAGYNIAFTAENVPPHNDNAQYAHPPSGQVLAMLVNDATGGNSVVVDGWSILHKLQAADPAAIEVLSRVEVGFRQYSVDADAFCRSPLVVRDRAGRFTHLRFSNQLMQPLEFDDPDLAEWYRAYRILGTMIADPANHVGFRLTAGDMLFVNGYRVLHARTEFVPDGPRHLQDVYFDVDDVFGNLARMTGEAPVEMTAALPTT